jgi:hypothetical protein
LAERSQFDANVLTLLKRIGFAHGFGWDLGATVAGPGYHRVHQSKSRHVDPKDIALSRENDSGNRHSEDLTVVRF